jgi:putative ATPase
MVIFASEDIGNADPFALVLANAAWDAVEKVGLPECRINLGHAVCYLATAPKSNASYLGIEKALADVRAGRTLPVPKHLKDANYRGAKEQFGHGVGYKYAHDHEGGWVEQEYVPADVEYYQPTDRGHEAKIKARLEELRKRKVSREPKASGGRQPPEEKPEGPR